MLKITELIKLQEPFSTLAAGVVDMFYFLGFFRSRKKNYNRQKLQIWMDSKDMSALKKIFGPGETK